MAGKSDAYETDILGLLFNATPIANIADNAATNPLPNLFLALHTADPTDAGTQDANETSYPNYARASVARTSSGFTVSGNTVNLTSDVAFPQAGVGASGTITHFSVGVAASGATKILYAGTVSPNITLGENVTPRLTTGTQITED